MKETKKTEKVVGIAIFSALAVVVALVCNVIPPVAGFLSLDVKDAVITVAALIYGPVSAVAISFIAALIELITFSTTGGYGFIMNFVSSTFFSLTVSIIYSKRRTLNTAIIACFAGVAVTTGAMLLMNIFVTPLYLSYIGVQGDVNGQVMGMLPTILLPFNFAKTLLNSATVLLIYKPVAIALARTGVSKKETRDNLKFTRSSLVITVVGAASMLVAIGVLLIISL